MYMYNRTSPWVEQSDKWDPNKAKCGFSLFMKESVFKASFRKVGLLNYWDNVLETEVWALKSSPLQPFIHW